MSDIFGTQSFPKFDSLHAHCAMTMTFPVSSCLDAFNAMKDAVETWTPEPGTAGGSYALWNSEEELNIWATRTTPVKKYVDDIYFEYTNSTGDFNTKGCTVAAKSRSQSLSYYDYSTNFCNMWNVFQVVKDTGSMAVSDCKFPADDPKTVCAKY